MDLRTYLNGLTPAQQQDFAARCGTSIGYLRKTISTGQRLGEQICVAIERESDQAVTRQELRPDDWQKSWPEIDSSGERRTGPGRRQCAGRRITDG